MTTRPRADIPSRFGLPDATPGGGQSFDEKWPVEWIRPGAPVPCFGATEGRAAARWFVNRAISRGEIYKPDVCPICSRSHRRIHAHHENYSFPLSVHFMCAECHYKRHHWESYLLLVTLNHGVLG